MNEYQIMVGREKEKKLLSECIEKAQKFEGRALIIEGEAGIGKSSLVEFLKTEAERAKMTVCIGESTVADCSKPYFPIQKALEKLTDNTIFQNEEFVYFNEIFLISKIGLLISHVSRTHSEGLDEDILGSMLTAVQDFVKDSFGDTGSENEKGGLGKLEYQNTKIFIEHGDLVYMAVVTSGKEHPDMKQEIRRTLSEIETNYFDTLSNWDGDIDSLTGTVGILKKAVDRKFSIKRSLENINLDTERIKVQNKVLEVIREKSGKDGLLLILEDLHWADDSTVHTLPYIARNITESNIILCITNRSGDSDAQNESFIKIIKEITADAETSIVISLQPLDELALKDIAMNLLHQGNPPEELLANLIAESDGNPFFVIEAIRALISDGTLYKSDDVWILKHGPKSAIPHNVSELVSRRLENLNLDELRVIEYGAVLGRRFSSSLLSSGFSKSGEWISDVTEALIDMNFLSRSKNGELLFQHSKMQEVIYSGLSGRWRKALHKNAGIVIEIQHINDVDPVLFNLAYHFSNAQDFDKGVAYCISAGYKASNNLAPGESIRFFEQAVGLMDLSGKADDRYPQILEYLGELYELDGNYPLALSAYGHVIKKESNLDTQTRLIMKTGRVYQAQGDYDNAMTNYEVGAAIAEKGGYPFWKAKINGYLGKIFLRKGEYERSLELQREYLRESTVNGDLREIGQAYMNIGGVYWHMNDQQSAIRNWGEALKIFEKANYLQGIANTHDNLGVGFSTVGEFDKSLAHYLESEVIMRKIGDVKGLSMVLLNIGVLYDRMGDNAKSLDYYKKSLQIKKKIGDRIGAATLYNNMGGAYYDMGRHAEAVENITQNLELMEKFNDTWGIAQALNNLANVKIEMNMIDEARILCERSIQIALDHDFKEILASCMRLRGILAYLDGDYEKADSNFKESLRLAEEVDDPQRIGMVFFSMGKSFLARAEKERAVDCFSLALKTFEKSKMETLARKSRYEMRAIVDSVN